MVDAASTWPVFKLSRDEFTLQLKLAYGIRLFWSKNCKKDHVFQVTIPDKHTIKIKKLKQPTHVKHCLPGFPVVGMCVEGVVFQ